MSEDAAGETVEFDYVEGQGPGVAELPPTPPADPDPAVAAGAPPVVWDQQTVEQFLRGTGEGIHMLAGVAERDWQMTEKDLERIAPPLTRIANRYEAVLQLAPVADPLLVAHGMTLYAWRSTLERKRAVRDAQEELRRRDGYDVVDHDADIGQEEQPVDVEEGLAEAPEDAASYFPDSPRARSTST
jgi:hypothetical protein